jgi:hypothetical protein
VAANGERRRGVGGLPRGVDIHRLERGRAVKEGDGSGGCASASCWRRDGCGEGKASTDGQGCRGLDGASMVVVGAGGTAVTVIGARLTAA